MGNRFIQTLVSAVGFLLVVAGLAVAYWWHYRMAPVRRSLDPDWVATHSQQDYWHEVQKGIRRGTWNHDDGFTVGYYGDESWARWIMARVKPGDNMGCAYTLSHSAESMRYITNFAGGDDADGWLVWWRANQGKTQRQWIADGFRKRGLTVDYPLQVTQAENLLRILGRTRASDDEEFLKYNSFRWLRDSDFEPVEYALSHREPSNEIETGLREYAKLEARFPRTSRLGSLPLSPRDDASANVPAIVTRRAQTTLNAVIWVSIVLGVSMLCLSLRTVRKQKAITRIGA